MMSSPEIGFERLTRMSVISGVHALRNYVKKFPHIDKSKAITALRRGSYVQSNHDYDGASILDELLPDISEEDYKSFIRQCLSIIIDTTHPLWLAKATLGRQAIQTALGKDQLQCFKAAGLFDPYPCEVIVEWWDNIAAAARTGRGLRLVNIGREGERLSFEYELARIKSLGIDKEIKWMGLDDQLAGYDIWSYDHGQDNPISRLIEVKSCSTYPLKFHLSRNEWNTALICHGTYVFQIWHLPSRTMYEISPQDIVTHIPRDQGNGFWETVQITLDNTPL
jgi:hypothetical protein